MIVTAGETQDCQNRADLHVSPGNHLTKEGRFSGAEPVFLRYSVLSPEGSRRRMRLGSDVEFFNFRDRWEPPACRENFFRNGVRFQRSGAIPTTSGLLAGTALLK